MKWGTEKEVSSSNQIDNVVLSDKQALLTLHQLKCRYSAPTFSVFIKLDSFLGSSRKTFCVYCSFSDTNQF